MKKRLLILLVVLLLVATGCQMPFLAKDSENTENITDAILEQEDLADEVNAIFQRMDEKDDEVVDSEEVGEVVNESEADEVENESNGAVDDMPLKVYKEGDLVSFKNIAYDPDGDNLQYTFEKPLGADGTWQTEMGDAGTYVVEITVSDGKLESSQDVKIIIESINNLPVISNFDSVEVDEGDLISFVPEVSDADDDDLSMKYLGFMDSDEYRTTYDDAGNYQVTLVVSDGKQEARKTVDVVINNVNRDPKFDRISDVSVIEGELVELDIEVSDPDSDELSVSYSKPLDENGTWQTSKGDANTYDIEVVVSDGQSEVSETIEIIVNKLNHAPVLVLEDDIEVYEGELIDLDPKVSDVDEDSLSIEYSGFMTSSKYQTTYDDAGVQTVIVSVSDGISTVSKNVTITILDKNRGPVFVDGAFD